MTTAKLKIWADAVKARDGKCVCCGRAEDLHAHHIKPKASSPELKLDVSNGKTLCYRCHKAEHEKNRPVRVRSKRPQRRTMEARIAWLESRLVEYEKAAKKLTHLVGVCQRGSCRSALGEKAKKWIA